MNWDAIGATGEIVGAAAVVVTLFYLALQIKANSRQAKRHEMNSTLQQISVGRLTLAQNEQLAALIPRGLDDYSALNPGEKVQFDAIMNERYWTMAYIWERVEEGLMDREYWNGAIHGSTLQTIHTAGCAAWWETAKMQFPESYRDEIERIRDSGSNNA